MWFTRGWALQELLAPSSAEFFSKEGVNIGSKGSSLEQIIHDITGIPMLAFPGHTLYGFSIDERFAWTKRRNTIQPEGKSYCLSASSKFPCRPAMERDKRSGEAVKAQNRETPAALSKGGCGLTQRISYTRRECCQSILHSQNAASPIRWEVLRLGHQLSRGRSRRNTSTSGTVGQVVASAGYTVFSGKCSYPGRELKTSNY
jgi:hypothetical protein